MDFDSCNLILILKLIWCSLIFIRRNFWLEILGQFVGMVNQMRYLYGLWNGVIWLLYGLNPCPLVTVKTTDFWQVGRTTQHFCEFWGPLMNEQWIGCMYSLLGDDSRWSILVHNVYTFGSWSKFVINVTMAHVNDFQSTWKEFFSFSF